MQTSIRKTGKNAYLLNLGEAELTLDGQALKNLLLQITRILLPQEKLGVKPEDEARELAKTITAAEDIGIQKLLLTAEQEDILVLLKTAEDDAAFQEKVYGNMSEKARKVFTEDVAFKYGELLSKTEIRDAVGRLKLVMKRLTDEGTLQPEG